MRIHVLVAGEVTVVAAIAAGQVIHRYVDSLLHSTSDVPAVEGHMYNRRINRRILTVYLPEVDPKYTQLWFYQGVLHRAGDLPAVVCNTITLDGRKVVYKEWFESGLIHRANGPASTVNDKPRDWAIYGACARKHSALDTARVMRAHVTAHYRGGRLHCIDGPAIVRANGDREWWLNGKLQRCAEQSDCMRFAYLGWAPVSYVTSALHNMHTPAIEYADGNREWHSCLSDTVGIYQQGHVERDGIQYHMVLHSRLPSLRLSNGRLMWIAPYIPEHAADKVTFIDPPAVFSFEPHELTHFRGISADTVYDYGIPRAP